MYKNSMYTLEKPPINIMKYIQLYLLFTFVFYFIGPVSWRTQNLFALVFLVGAYQLFFWIGYQYQIVRPVKPAKNIIGEKSFYIKHFGFIAIVAIVLNILLFIRITVLYGLDSIGKTIVMSFTDPAALYAASSTEVESSQMFGGTLLANINAIASPIFFAVIPIGLILYKELSLVNKVLFWFATASTVLLSISTGRGEGIMRIVVFLVVWLIIGGKRKKANKEKSKKALKIVLVILIVVAFLFIYSAFMQNRTLGSYGLPIGSNLIDYNNFVFTKLPDSMQDLFVYLNIYMTQGYYGMSISLDKPWIPTFFGGFSSWFRGEIEGFLGVDIKSNTFMARALDGGWKYGTNWHTAYTWFACDVSWIGVILIMFLMGRLVAAVYKDSYYNKNPLAIGLLVLMILFVIYLPANNYVFADSDTFITFFVYLVLWGIKFVYGYPRTKRGINEKNS